MKNSISTVCISDVPVWELDWGRCQWQLSDVGGRSTKLVNSAGDASKSKTKVTAFFFSWGYTLSVLLKHWGRQTVPSLFLFFLFDSYDSMMFFVFTPWSCDLIEPGNWLYNQPELPAVLRRVTSKSHSPMPLFELRCLVLEPPSSCTYLSSAVWSHRVIRTLIERLHSAAVWASVNKLF